MAPARETTMPATRRTRKSTSGFSPAKTTDKENATIDFGARGAASSSLAANRKKSRSKSMGPGGLDALKSTSGNRRVSLAAPSRPPPRSILKPTMPILPDIPPLRTKAKGIKGASRASPARGMDKKIALRTEEEQQAAAREREREERERAAREKEVNDHREARRKSLANRRVSFAAEATLHTFHEIEYAQDSTTSTESTARRASSAASLFDNVDDPLLPPSASEQLDEATGASSRPQQRRRSSILGFRSSGDDNTMTSTVYDSDGDGVEEDDDSDNVQEDLESEAESDSDEGDGATMVTVEADETTSASVMSAMSAMSGMSERSASPIESTSDLEEALRLATQHAGAAADKTRQERPIGEDEEVIPAFIGWGKKATQQRQQQQQQRQQQLMSQDATETNMSMDMSMDVDMEMTRAMGGIIRSADASDKMEEDMSMDVTRVYGGIISRQKQMALETDSVASSPMVMHDDMTVGSEMPMELTTAIGGIRSALDQDSEWDDNEGLEDMSMELTTVMGRVLARQSRRGTLRSMMSEEDEAPMDMTMGVGHILAANGGSAAAEAEEVEMEDVTVGMDMTTALGGILQTSSPARTRSMAAASSKESTLSTTPTTARLEAMSLSPPKTAKTAQNSPGSAFRGKGLHRTPAQSPARKAVEKAAEKAAEKTAEKAASKSAPKSAEKTTPKVAPKSAETTPKSAPKAAPKAASKAAPKAAPSTPSKSASPKRFIGSRSQSPKRNAAAPAEASTTPKSPPKKAGLLGRSPFATTPSVILTPQNRTLRQSVFAGAGPASPKITEIFNRRSSLLDSADFVVGSANKPERPAVTFDEPEREPEAEPRPSTSAQDDHEATQNLRDLIQGLSPKKNPLKGRKSLHVGSAKGLLGKRPFELDDDIDEDAEGQDLVKRLKGNESSPVKNIRLQQPPSVMETIGRSSRSRRSPSATPLIDILPDTPKPAEENEVPMQEAAEGGEEDGEHIHLQEFLNMAGIHFMELETTKRRATEVMPQVKKSSRPSAEDDSAKDPETEELVTSVCKVPLLEMYQHACRELKNYIEEGRSIMREIETETHEENPPIFREYMTATPELRTQMDNQFKNIKIFARLQSKKQWYEWRTKLHQGLQEGMSKTLQDLEKDDSVLQQRRAVVDAVYPGLQAEYEAASQEMARLEKFAQQLGGEEREALLAARRQKQQLQASIERRKQETTQLQAETKASKERVAAMKVEREQYLQELEEAKRVQEERRSWSHQEISSLRAQVDALERKSGWKITGAQGTTLSLTYRREIELVFDAASFRPGQANTQIDVWYVGEAHKSCQKRQASPPAPIAVDFFLQGIRDHVRSLRQAETSPARLLQVVRASWDRAKQATNQIRQLNVTFPTTTTRTSDTSLAIAVPVLLVPLQTKVEMTVHLHTASSASGLQIGVTTAARVVYGESFHAAKMAEFLSARMGEHVMVDGGVAGKSKGSGQWVDAVEELRGKLAMRGRKEVQV